LATARWDARVIAAVRLGTQGWNYPAWIGSFYPPGTRRQDMLGLYARAFATVEVDSTFYAIPPAPVVQAWRDRVPHDFRFALKVPQQVTHECRLVNADEWLGKFLGRADLLEDRLGPLLVQLPPDFVATAATRAALAAFVRGLPGDHRWAVEFRHPDWISQETLDLLQPANVALTLTEARWVRPAWMRKLAERPTADFAYVRWLGPDRRITQFASVQIERDAELDGWSDVVRELGNRVREVYGYANNHWEGHSPGTVRRLQARLRLPVTDPLRLRDQAELFSGRDGT
jgi:uncharacterized protein YecE (DUF72 family)